MNRNESAKALSTTVTLPGPGSLRVGLRHRAPVRAVRGPLTEVAFATMDLDGPLAGWKVEAEFTLERGEVVHGPVTFTPTERVPFGSLTAGALRRLSLQPALVEFENLLRQLEAAAPGVGAVGWVDALTAGKRPGRRSQDPSVYLLWARRRVEAEHQDPTRPIKWMVDRWGGEPHHYTEQAINKYVYMAREKGFLTPASEPVDLTPQAKRLLAKGATDGKR